MSTPRRTAEIQVLDGGRRVVERWLEGPPCRLASVLVRERRAETGAGALRVIGAGWIDDAGGPHWGWPAEDDRLVLRPAPAFDWRACLLPPALSLALCMRRRRTDLGLHSVVLGKGLLAEIATAVAEAVGCRVTRKEDEDGSTWSAPIVIEASGRRPGLETALARCEDWGVVYSLAGGLSSSAVDYYTDVHRRALTVCRVPEVPVPAPGEGAVLDGGVAVLVPALGRRVLAAPGTGETAVLQPGDRPARLVRDASGLCLITDAGGR